MRTGCRPDFNIALILMTMALSACLLTACTRSTGPGPTVGETTAGSTASIYVVNYPLQYFAQRIGGKHVRAVFPAPPAMDPAFWRPDAETIAEFQKADLILLNGAAYAKWIRTVTLPESKIIDTSVALADQYIEVDGAVTHSHGPGEEHAHAGIAFTTWLDPQMAIARAKAIQVALAKLRPQHESDFQQGFESLKSDLEDLDEKLRTAVNGKTGRAVVFSHPVFQYLQRRYNLNGKSVHWEPDAVPSSMMWNEFEKMLVDHPATSMIWEGELIDENVRRLEELGLSSVIFDPCGNVSGDEDYLSIMRRNAGNLARVFSQ